MKNIDLLSEEKIKEMDLRIRDSFIGKCLVNVISDRHKPFNEVSSIRSIKIVRYEITETNYVAIGNDSDEVICIPLIQLEMLHICGWCIFFKGNERYIIISWDCITSLMLDIMHSPD